MSHIIRQWNGRTIRQRENGYLSATDMCQACGKLFADWKRLKSTSEYLVALQESMGIPIDDLIDINESNGSNEDRGAWVHRRVSIRLAQWLSPSFAVKVDEWTEELMLNGKVELKSQSQIQEVSVKDEIDVLSQCLSIAGLDPRLVAGIALNHAGVRMPQLKGAIAEGHSLLAASGQTDLLLTPTKIGEELGLSGRKVNEILINLGFQVKNTGKKSKTEPDYLVTSAGMPYAGNTMATGKLLNGKPDNTTYQHLKWKINVIDAIREQLTI